VLNALSRHACIFARSLDCANSEVMSAYLNVFALFCLLLIFPSQNANTRSIMIISERDKLSDIQCDDSMCKRDSRKILIHTFELLIINGPSLIRMDLHFIFISFFSFYFYLSALWNTTDFLIFKNIAYKNVREIYNIRNIK